MKSILGVDLSQNMVDVYNRKVWQQGISKDEMEAICLELKEGSDNQDDQLNGRKFDFIIVRPGGFIFFKKKVISPY